MSPKIIWFYFFTLHVYQTNTFTSLKITLFCLLYKKHLLNSFKSNKARLFIFFVFNCKLRWQTDLVNRKKSDVVFLPNKYHGWWSVILGFYCVASNVVAGDVSTVMTVCPEGYYCPNGTGFDWQPCPAGTYSTVTQLTQESECTPCDGGSFCSSKFNVNYFMSWYFALGISVQLK